MRLKIGALILVLLTIAISHFFPGSAMRKVGLAIEYPEYNFGKVEQLTTVERQFKITNRTNKTVAITRLHKQCSCTSAEVLSNCIKAGQSTYLMVKIEPGKRNGNFQTQLSVDWKEVETGTSGSNAIMLRYNAVSLVEGMPRFLDFGEVNVNQKPVKLVTHLSHGGSEMKWNGLKCVSHQCAVVVIQKSQDQYEISVELDPSRFPIGMVSDELDITLMSEGGNLLKQVDESIRKGMELELQGLIRIKAKIVGDIKALPESVYLGRIQTAGIHGGTFTIKNTGARPLQLVSVVSTSPGRLSANAIGQNSEGLGFNYEMNIKEGDRDVSGVLLIRVRDEIIHEIAIPVLGYYSPTVN